MNKDLLDEITDIEVLKNGYRQLNKLVMIKEDKLDKRDEEIERLNNIIKEAKEYSKKHSSYPKTDVFGIPKFLVFNGDIEELLEILDKGE